MEIEYISSLIELFERSSLTELQISEENKEITLKREKEIQVQTITAAPIGGQAGIPMTAAQQAEEPNVPQENDCIIISSPIVGTFYRTPAPDAPPFIEVGDIVKTGDALCIIEAMKMMNRLEAEFPCEVVAILAQHGDLVEYGAALVEVKRI